jgi:hypothetical protein
MVGLKTQYKQVKLNTNKLLRTTDPCARIVLSHVIRSGTLALGVASSRIATTERSPTLCAPILYSAMNQTTTHKIVSNADTLIALKNPCTRFADWGKPAPSSRAEIEEATWGYSTSRSIRRKKKKSKGYKALIGLSSDLDVPTASLIELTQANIAPPENGQSALADVTEEGDRKGSEQSLFGAGSLAVLEAAAPTRSGTGDGPSNASKHVAQDLEPVSTAMIESLEERQIHFHVCAGNLMSASPWFNRLLKKNGWMESNWNPEVRWFHISAEDWDEEAFVVLMNIFHLRNKRVPRAITVDMLAKIAVLADYYECGDSIQLLVDIWVPDLEKKFPIPSVYGRDLILWTWISWALRLPELFKHTTTIVIKQSIEPVRNPGLPIPSWITGKCYIE